MSWLDVWLPTMKATSIGRSRKPQDRKIRSSQPPAETLSKFAVDARNGTGGVIAKMAKTLKSQGRVELATLLQRTRRQLALGRINEHDATFIVERLLKIDQRICTMRELNELGEFEEIVDSGTEQDNNATDSG